MDSIGPITGNYAETLHWGTTANGFQSTIAVINYLGWAFPEAGQRQTDAKIFIRFFNKDGHELEPHNSTIETGQSFHLPIADHHQDFEGLVAAKLVPHGNMARRSARPNSPGRPIATSYFMLYERNDEFADFSHELFLLRERQNETPQEWATILFFDHGLSPAVIVMNNCALQDSARAASNVDIQLFTMEGQPISEVKSFSINPRGSKQIQISEIFSDINLNGINRATVAVTGTNIEQPMSLHLHDSGDFNLHHF